MISLMHRNFGGSCPLVEPSCIWKRNSSQYQAIEIMELLKYKKAFDSFLGEVGALPVVCFSGPVLLNPNKIDC